MAAFSFPLEVARLSQRHQFGTVLNSIVSGTSCKLKLPSPKEVVVNLNTILVIFPSVPHYSNVVCNVFNPSNAE